MIQMKNTNGFSRRYPHTRLSFSIAQHISGRVPCSSENPERSGLQTIYTCIATESVFTFLGHSTSFHRFVSLSQSGQGSVDFIIHATASICTFVLLLAFVRDELLEVAEIF